MRSTKNTSSCKKLLLLAGLSVTTLLILQSHLLAAADEDQATKTTQQRASDADNKAPGAPSPSTNLDDQQQTSNDKERYISPQVKSTEDLFLYEHFDDEQQFTSKWIPSSDPKYSGKASLEQALNRPPTDKQLLLPEKARYYGISSKLAKPFKFSSELNKPLIVQYEVEFRDGLDCGGAYIKLIRNSALNDLTKLDDKTPFTIMFGPDKCGSDSKLHFIIQYPNPKYEEKHWKKAKFVAPLTLFSDKLSHLFKLVLEPDNTFELFIDDSSVGKGNLLEDLEPEINPPKEIIDPNDSKPADWDDRAQIDDPDAKKPDDWDEDLPKQIDDPDAVKPSGWLDDEPKYIPDPEAKKPEDWEDMDGEWEAPLIENPACASAPGCGEWVPPKVANPKYVGKWKAPKIDNPNYKGKWTPRVIPNPEYFYDENPFTSLDSIGAVAFELWTMAENIAFDNLIITSDKLQADNVKEATWKDKRPIPEAGKSMLENIGDLFKEKTYLTYIVAALISGLALLVGRSLMKSKKSGDESVIKKKKHDESRPDDILEEETGPEEAEHSGQVDEDDPEVLDDNEEQVSDEEGSQDAGDVTEEDADQDEDEEDEVDEAKAQTETAGVRKRESRRSGTKK